MMQITSEEILSGKNLTLYYRTRRGIVKAVDQISFKLRRGETLAIVGESGSGKSSFANAVYRILPRNVEKYEGEVLLDGVDIMKYDEEEYRKKVRWKRISMVFQGAMNSLNPVLSIGFQIAEPLIIHQGMQKDEALKKAAEALKTVGIHPSYINRYPHQLSGGMKQRVVIAMALVLSPQVVILDEPTSALDVITQANIINLLKRLKKELKLSYIFITHDLALTSELADTVAVMYAGKVVETSPSEVFYRNPRHPYSKGLLESVPALKQKKKINFIPGEPPDLVSPPSGCRFHPRCPYAMEICRKEEPKNKEIEGNTTISCWLY
jgi:peptide/nickel transport system ATP-binding protein